MGDNARQAAVERFLRKHRERLAREAAQTHDQVLVAALGAAVELDADGDGVSVTLVWSDAEGKHEQRLAPFGREYLTSIDINEFGGDCDMDFI